MDYILMNKDTPYALFSCEHDEFGEERAVLREWYTDLRPISLRFYLTPGNKNNVIHAAAQLVMDSLQKAG